MASVTQCSCSVGYMSNRQFTWQPPFMLLDRSDFLAHQRTQRAQSRSKKEDVLLFSCVLCVLVAALQSKPNSHARDHHRVVRILTGGEHQILGIPDLAFPLHAEIGRELAANFIAQTQPEADARESRADEIGRIVLAVRLELELR